MVDRKTVGIMIYQDLQKKTGGNIYQKSKLVCKEGVESWNKCYFRNTTTIRVFEANNEFST